MHSRKVVPISQLKEYAKVPNTINKRKVIMLLGVLLIVIPQVFFNVKVSLDLSQINTIPEIITLIGGVICISGALIHIYKPYSCPVCTEQMEITSISEPHRKGKTFHICHKCKIFIEVVAGRRR